MFVITMRLYRHNILCTNCGTKGHILKECDEPITSFGIIAFKKVLSETDDLIENDELEDILKISGGKKQQTYPKYKLLLIQRKDTIGYTDFVRGKYPSLDSLKIYFSEMTELEQKKLLTCDFDYIWSTLWLNHNSKTYKNEYNYAKSKFESVDIEEQVKAYPAKYKYQEFGFPKGRRNLKELDKSCAIREFAEETGYKYRDYNMMNDVILENFTGTDGVMYKHVYYLAEMKTNVHVPFFNKNNRHQVEEIKNIGFFDKAQIVSLLRPYDKVKLQVVNQVFERLENPELWV